MHREFLCGENIKIIYSKFYKNKGDVDKISISPLFIFQENDSLFKEEYKKNKELFLKEKYSESLENSLQLLKDIKNSKVKNIELEYLCNFLIGDIFRSINNHDKALEYFKKSLSFFSGNRGSLFDDLNFTFNNFNAKEEEAKSLLKVGYEYFKLNNSDSALYYYNRIININSLEIEGIESVKASAYNNLSGVYLQDSLYDTAKIYALKAVELRRKSNKKVPEAAALGNLATIHLEEKNFEEAKRIYFKAIRLIEKDTASTAVRYKEKLYYNLAWTLYLLKDYTAYEYQEKSYEILDGIRNKEIREIVEGVYAKYQEQYKVETLKNKARLEEAQERKTNWFLGILMVLILGISGFMLYTYKLRQRNLKLKLEQTEFAQKSKLDKLKSESQVRILNATLDGKETERKQIAETLHDSVSSLLSSANLHLQATKMQFNADQIKQLLVEAKLPYWPPSRKNILVWLVQDDGSQRSILWENSASELVTQFKTLSELRGLPVTIPMKCSVISLPLVKP